MKILTVDIGTGTQDILLYDSRLDLENAYKCVVPSPTMIVHRQIRRATRERVPILLTGVTMGGGPSQWAVEEHIRSGLTVFATPAAARSFNDDLQAVADMGVTIVAEEEIDSLSHSAQRLALRDFDFDAIANSLRHFGVTLDDLAAIAVAVFDHGNAPPGISDRQFRFDYLDQRIRQENRLSGFAYLAEQIPPILTRFQAVVHSARSSAYPVANDLPLVVMDTAPAAVLGATYDPQVRLRFRTMIVNIGNFHTLAFRLGPTGIEGVFEHHTGLLTLPKLEALLIAFAEGSLTHTQVFDDHGHGALIYHPQPLSLGDLSGWSVAVTGPKRNLIFSSELRPYFAVPFGDMMLTGCVGLLAATADLLPELRGDLEHSLSEQSGKGCAPWEVYDL